MKNSILENNEEAPQKKIQLLLVIQNDYKNLGNRALSDETLNSIIELIKTLPQEEKKSWVEKAASALHQLQLHEKAQHLVTTHNESIEELADLIPLHAKYFSRGISAFYLLRSSLLSSMCKCTSPFDP